jgi:hypothetical protein
MTVDWGDSSPTESDATFLEHTYPNTNNKIIELSCPDLSKLIDIHSGNSNFVDDMPSFSAYTSLETWDIYYNDFDGSPPSFSACTALTYIDFYSNGLDGNMPSFATCTELTFWGCAINGFTGTMPDFSPCTKLTVWQADSNNFTGYTIGSFATQKDLGGISFDNNNLTQIAVDAVLADCVTSLSIPGRVTCTVTLDGASMASPSVDGYDDVDTLIAAGWDVTVN